jgi:hypothetical protein
MDLDGAHQEDLLTAESVVNGCQMMRVFIAIYFCTFTISWGVLLKYFIDLVLIVITLLG